MIPLEVQPFILPEIRKLAEAAYTLMGCAIGEHLFVWAVSDINVDTPPTTLCCVRCGVPIGGPHANVIR